MENSLNALRLLAALSLSIFALAAQAAEPPQQAPVVDPLDAVLDPAWKPPAPPKAPPPPEAARSGPASAASSAGETSTSARKESEQREDAPGYRSVFNSATLLPPLEKDKVAGLLIGGGLASIDDATFVQLGASMYLTDHLVIGAVLNHAIASTNPAYPKGKNRLADYDEWRDWLRLVQKWDSPLENGGYFRVGQLGNQSQGESGLIQNLSNNLLADTARFGIALDVRRNTWWMNALIGDATFLAPVVGAQVGLIPFGESDTKLLASLKLSGYYAGDLDAPTALLRNAKGAIAVTDEHRPLDQTELLHGYGFDLRLRPLDTEHLYADVYGAYNQLIGQGNGLHAGVRLGARSETTSIELKGEVRLLGAHYLPHYFDSFYDVQRTSYLSGDPATAALTKLAYLRTLGHEGRLQTYLAGARLNVGNLMGLEATYETGADSLLGVATLHAQVNVGSELALFATYQRRSFGAGGEWFNFDANELLNGRIRLQLAEGFFLTGFATRTFVWEAAAYKAAWSGGAQASWLFGT